LPSRRTKPEPLAKPPGVQEKTLLASQKILERCYPTTSLKEQYSRCTVKNVGYITEEFGVVLPKFSSKEHSRCTVKNVGCITDEFRVALSTTPQKNNTPGVWS